MTGSYEFRGALDIYLIFTRVPLRDHLYHQLLWYDGFDRPDGVHHFDIRKNFPIKCPKAAYESMRVFPVRPKEGMEVKIYNCGPDRRIFGSINMACQNVKPSVIIGRVPS